MATKLKVAGDDTVRDIDTFEEAIKRIKEIEISYNKLLAILETKRLITPTEALQLDID